MAWIIKTLVDGKWEAVAPSDGLPPFYFTTEDDAKAMTDILYSTFSKYLRVVEIPLPVNGILFERRDKKNKKSS